MKEGVIVFGSPVAVGHVRPLMPLAKRLVARGHSVIWAISGDDNEPASKWRAPFAEIGATLVDLDSTVKFTRGKSAELNVMELKVLFRRLPARANDVSEAAATAIEAAIAGRRVVAGIYDYFAMWFYVAMRRLHIDAPLSVVISAFPSVVEGTPSSIYTDDEVFQREVAQLRAAGVGSFASLPRGGLIPDDPKLRVLCFSSPRLCSDAPSYVQLLGVQRDALPRVQDVSSAPAEHQELVTRLEQARASGSPVLLISMGTVALVMAARMGAAPFAFLKRLYSTFASAALRSGAVVVASTCDSSAADLGVDEATLGPAARDRVFAMKFVPQPLLFAHGLVDAMVMHGGANTFYEAIVSGIPLLVSPAFGDQEFVAYAAERLGVGVYTESMMLKSLKAARSIDQVAAEVVPAMLAPGDNTWKLAARKLAEFIKAEDGLDAAEAAALQ